MKSIRAVQGSHAILLLSLLGVFVPVIVLIHFARPLADDFSFANSAHQFGLFGAIRHQYFTWQGRWLGNGFSFAADSLGSPRIGYTAYLYLALASLFASIALLAHSLFQIKARVAFTWAACALAIYISRMPSPAETLYWTTGSFENHFSIALMICCLAALLRGGRVPPAPSRWEGAMFPLLFAIVVAGHELYGVICFIVLSAGAVVMWRTKSPRARLWAACAAGAAVGLAVVILAPGNAIRAHNYPDHGKIGPTLKAVIQEARDFEPYGIDLSLWLAGLLFVVSAPDSAGEPTWRIYQLKRPLTFAVAVAALIAAAALLAPAWALGSPMPARTLDACLLLMILGAFVIAHMLYWHLRRTGWLNGPTNSDARRLVAGFAPGVLGLALLCGPNVITAFFDCVTSARHYAHAMDERTALLNASAHQSKQADVVLPPITPFPKSFASGGEIDPDATDWKNNAVATFYGVKSVRLDAPITVPVLGIQQR